MAANPIPKITAAEYLAIEQAAEFRSEFVNGEVVAMAGGSFSHVVLVSNLCGELRNELRGKGCRAVSSDLLFRVGTGRLFTYPDVMVFCGPVEFADERRIVALNPVVVAEVLSPSTEAFDRGRKAAEYRKCDGLRQYLLVSQNEPLIEIHSRDTDGLWKISEVSGMDARCELESIGVGVEMRSVYDGVELNAG